MKEETAKIMYKIITSNNLCTCANIKEYIGKECATSTIWLKKKKIIKDIFDYAQKKITSKDYLAFQQLDRLRNEHLDESYGILFYCLIYGDINMECYKSFVGKSIPLSPSTLSRKNKKAKYKIADFYYRVLLKDNEQYLNIDQEDKKEVQSVDTAKTTNNNTAISTINPKNNISLNDEYKKRVAEDIKYIDAHDNRIPLYPSDRKNPYKKELWYKYEEIDFKTKNDKDNFHEKYSEESLSVPMMNQMMFFDNYKAFELFPLVDVYGELFNDEYLPDLCREAKKGTGTRGLISHNIRYLVDELVKMGKGDKHTIDEHIDNTLKEWEFPSSEVRTSIPCGTFKVRRRKTSDIGDWKKYLDMPVDDVRQVIENMNYYASEKITNNYDMFEFKQQLLREKLEMSEDEIYRFFDDIEDTKRYCEESEDYIKLRFKQFKFVIIYNSKIGLSKLNFLQKEIHKKYNVTETQINLKERNFLIEYLKLDTKKKFFGDYNKKGQRKK